MEGTKVPALGRYLAYVGSQYNGIRNLFCVGTTALFP